MAEDRMQLETGLKRALEWVSRSREEQPGTRLGALIEEACRRYDLTPGQSDFLYRHFLSPAGPGRPA